MALFGSSMDGKCSMHAFATESHTRRPNESKMAILSNPDGKALTSGRQAVDTRKRRNRYPMTEGADSAAILGEFIEEKKEDFKIKIKHKRLRYQIFDTDQGLPVIFPLPFSRIFF